MAKKAMANELRVSMILKVVSMSTLYAEQEKQ
jgi:hypothetical protein